MKRNIFNIIIMLLTMSAAFSCQALSVYDEVSKPAEESGILISGTVSDIDTDTPLEGIKLSFTAFAKEANTGTPILEMNVYSDNLGIYSVEASGFEGEITCLITATDPDDVYEGACNEVEIRWSGISFDSSNSTFIVNDCDFKLKRK